MNQNSLTIADEIASMEGLQGEVALASETAKVEVETEVQVEAGGGDETSEDVETEDAGEGEGEEGNAGEEAAETVAVEGGEGEDLREQVGYLTERINQLTGVIEALKPVTEPAKFELETTDFVSSDADYDSAMQSKEGLNAALNKAAQYGAAKAVEHTLTKFPELTRNTVLQAVDNAIMIHMFFKDNKDLVAIGDANESYREKTAKVYRDLEKRFPAKKTEQLFGILAAEVRKTYKVTPIKKSGKLPAAIVPGKGVERKVTTKSKKVSIADEIAGMERAR